MLEDQLLFAVANGFTERVALLLAHGVDPLGRGTSHPALGGLGAVEIAAADRHLEIVELLVGAGAPRPVFDPVDQLLGALLAGDRGATETLLATRPTLVREALRRVPARIVRAAELGRLEAVTLLADVGFDVNARERTTALHEAAWRGDRVLVELLLSLGADATIRDREHHGTPAGWAHHNGHAELAAYLAEIEQQS
jgi:ankyrin repeat protein